MRDAARISAAPPERLAPLFVSEVGTGLFVSLVAKPRFRDRILLLAAKRLGSLPDVGRGVERLLSMDGRELVSFAHRVGAVWHAVALARVVAGESRRRLADSLGHDTIRLALAGRDVAPPIDGPSDVDTITDAIPPSGAAALAAWCAVQPEPVARRLELLRPSADAGSIHRARGPAVVDWVLERT